MKKTMLLTAGLLAAAFTWAQTNENKLPVKKIEVTGTAEMEITPDEIYFVISLREYKNKNNKVEITTLEKQLQKAILDAGIAKENFTISNVYGSNYQPWTKKKVDPDFMARKQYTLKLSRLDKLNLILAAIDAEGIESVNISGYTHSKMEDYRKQVKIKAMQAAKAKADYMLEAIGSAATGILEVQEINTDNYGDVRPMMANMMYKSLAASDAAESNIDFKTIKIRAEVRTVFQIK